MNTDAVLTARLKHEHHMWQYKFHQPHLINIATLPCWSQNIKNVILQQKIPKKLASNVSYVSSKWTRAMCLIFSYFTINLPFLLLSVMSLIIHLMQTWFVISRATDNRSMIEEAAFGGFIRATAHIYKHAANSIRLSIKNVTRYWCNYFLSINWLVIKTPNNQECVAKPNCNLPGLELPPPSECVHILAQHIPGLLDGGFITKFLSYVEGSLPFNLFT